MLCLKLIASKILFLNLFLGSIASAFAQDRVVPLPSREERIAGIPVMFSGSMRLVPGAACQQIEVGVTITLDDLAAKLTRIVQAAIPAKNESCGDRQAIHAVRLSRLGEHLRVKVDGKVGRQECVKTKVPEFRGLKVTMRTRIVVSSTLESNVSVAAVFDPRVVNGNALRMVRVAGPDIRISNDLARFLVRAFGFDFKVNDQVAEAIDKTLRAERAMVRLPPELERWGITLSDARIVTESGALALRVDGTVPVPDTFRLTTFSLMGFPTTGCS